MSKNCAINLCQAQNGVLNLVRDNVGYRRMENRPIKYFPKHLVDSWIELIQDKQENTTCKTILESLVWNWIR